MKAELEGGDDAEVAAAPPQRPEQIGVVAFAGPQQLAVGRHHVGGQQIVDREPVLAAEPAETAAERQSGDSGRRVDAERRRPAERLRFAVEVAQRGTRRDARPPVHRVDPDGLHRRQIDEQAAVAHGVPGDVVAAAPNRQHEIVLAREPDRPDDVGSTQTADGECRSAVDHRVPNRARLVVSRLPGQDGLAAQIRSERIDDGRIESAHRFRMIGNLEDGHRNPPPALRTMIYDACCSTFAKGRCNALRRRADGRSKYRPRTSKGTTGERSMFATAAAERAGQRPSPRRNGESAANPRISASTAGRSASRKRCTARRRPECAIQCALHVGCGR